MCHSCVDLLFEIPQPRFEQWNQLRGALEGVALPRPLHFRGRDESVRHGEVAEGAFERMGVLRERVSVLAVDGLALKPVNFINEIIGPNDGKAYSLSFVVPVSAKSATMALGDDRTPR